MSVLSTLVRVCYTLCVCLIWEETISVLFYKHFPHDDLVLFSTVLNFTEFWNIVANFNDSQIKWCNNSSISFKILNWLFRLSFANSLNSPSASEKCKAFLKPGKFMYLKFLSMLRKSYCYLYCRLSAIYAYFTIFFPVFHHNPDKYPETENLCETVPSIAGDTQVFLILGTFVVISSRICLYMF